MNAAIPKADDYVLQAGHEPAPHPRGSRGASGEDTATSALALYMKDLDANPLIDPAREVSLARELREARGELARLALHLPATWRRELLDGDTEGPGRGDDWDHDGIESFCRRLARFRPGGPASRLDRVRKAVHRQKRRMDRARDALILANLRLVIFVARRYVREGVSLMDLIQEGNLGLIKAVEKFDHRLGNRFSTYAYWWIQQTIDRAITVKWRAVRVPVYLVTASRRIRRAAETLRRRLGREPTAEEVARHVGRSVREVETIASSAKVLPEELDAVGRDQVPRPDAPDVSPETPERGVEVREARELVRRALQTLTPRERKVVRLRFGIGGTEPGTLQQVGEVLHLSRERVRQIESAALNKLRASPPGPLRALPRAGEVARRAAAGA